MSRIKQKKQGVINSLVWTQQDNVEGTLSFDGTDFDFDSPVTIAGTLYTDTITERTTGAGITFGSKLASQLYSNPTGTSFTILKIHNHDTTAEIGGLETKGDLVNATGSVVGEQASWTYEPTGLTGSPSGVSASSNVLAVSPSYTVDAGNIYALVGQAQLYGTLNGGTVNVAGVIGILSGAGANTLVLHMAGVQSAISAGLVNPTTGTLSHFLANSTGTTGIDNLICVQSSAYITNVLNLETQGGCDTQAYTGNTTFAANSKGTFTQCGQLRIKIGASTYYIPYGTVA